MRLGMFPDPGAPCRIVLLLTRLNSISFRARLIWTVPLKAERLQLFARILQPVKFFLTLL